MTVCLCLINDDGVQQTFSTDGLDHCAVEISEAISEYLTKCLCSLDHLLLEDDLEGAYCDSTAKWIAAICGAVSPRFDREHDIFPSKYACNGIHSTRNC